MPDFLTPTEAAALLRVKVETLANWRAARTGPEYVKVGRSVRYERAAIEAYLKSRTVGA